MYRVTQRIRIEWSHCDPAGIIFNPHYYIWMDQGIHALLETVGFPFVEMVRTTPFRGCPLVTSSAEFMKPALLGDVITLCSQVERFGNKSFTTAHRFTRGPDLLATGKEVRVWASTDEADGETMIGIPVPEDVKTLLSADGETDVTP